MVRNIRIRLALLTLMGVVIWLLPFLSVYASNPCIVISQVKSTNQDVTLINNMVDEINRNLNAEMGITNFMTYSYSNQAITIELDNTQYRNMTQERKQELMSICLNGIQNSSVSATNRNKIYNFIADTDTAVSSLVRQLSADVTADFAGAYAWFKPFTSPISIILGVLAIGLFVCLGFSIIVDIAYLTIPLFAWALMRTSESQKPPLISVEAWSAYKEAESGTVRTPLGGYLKLKVKEYIVLGVCLLYLVSGELYTLVGYIVDYFSGLLPQ